MKKLLFLTFAAGLMACGETKETTETTPAVPKVVCDSVENVTIDSITGAQIFTKVYKCDTVKEEAK